jgi:5-methylcytosine-specific restriction endonuclease McrA
VHRGERCAYCEATRERVTPGRRDAAGFRRRTLAITGGACAICGSRDNVQAHHPTPVVLGGAATRVGVPLCAKCHGAEEARLRRAMP